MHCAFFDDHYLEVADDIYFHSILLGANTLSAALTMQEFWMQKNDHTPVAVFRNFHNNN